VPTPLGDMPMLPLLTGKIEKTALTTNTAVVRILPRVRELLAARHTEGQQVAPLLAINMHNTLQVRQIMLEQPIDAPLQCLGR